MVDSDQNAPPADTSVTPTPAQPILVEKGENPKVLIIAFTGFQGGMMLPTYDFLAISELLQYSRILLLDTAKTAYLGGVPPVAPTYWALRDQLRDHIAALAPEMTLCIGASSGGLAALLLGHALGADYVHAFSPFTYVNRETMEKNGDQNVLDTRAEDIDRIAALPGDVHPLFDLQPVLAQANGKTRYYVHVCGQSQWDLMRALHIRQCPDVSIIGYTCTHHAVTISLARCGLLTDVLKAENQNRIEEVVREKIVVRKVKF